MLPESPASTLARTLHANTLQPRHLLWAGYGVLVGVTLGLPVLSLLSAGSWYELFARSDVPAFYIGGHLVLAGQSPWLYDMTVQRAAHGALIAPYGAVSLDPFVHPPWVALLFTPLALLPFPAAFLVCAGLCLLIAAICLSRLIATTARTAAERNLLVLAGVGFLPLCVALLLGQLPLLAVWLSLTAAGSALQAGRDRRAGAWLLLGLIKPQLIALPILALLVARRWRALGVVAAGTAAVLAGSLLVLGNWVPGYLGFLADYMGADSGVSEITGKMQNWRALVYHLLGDDKSLGALLFIGALTVLSLAVVVFICRPRETAHPPQWEVRWAVTILLGLLVSPHLYAYDLLIALGPGYVLWGSAAGAGRRLRVLRAVLAAGPFVGLLPQFWPGNLALQIGPWYLGALLLAVAGAWPVWQGRAAQETEAAVAT